MLNIEMTMNIKALHWILIGIIFISIENNGQCQKVEKYVASKNGLTIRKEPFISSRSVGVLKYNDLVEIIDTRNLDTIENRVANWMRIRFNKEDEGFVFGGYLNKKPLPDFEYSSLRIYMNYLIESYDVEYEIERQGNESLKFQNRNIRIQGSVNHLLIHEYGYEWKNIELNLFDWELHEIINLIELATWFDENIEYEVFKQSITGDNFEKFKWINAFDDPEGTMVLEKRYPSGVRIIESSSL
jgi:hypothetical protein